MTYTKPFLEIEELVELVESQGMTVDHGSRMYLERAGYYRSGGYRYLFREMLPEDARDSRLRQYRKGVYLPGSSLAGVERIDQFDAKLRDVCMSGLLDFEVRVRAALAHVLSARSISAHCEPQHLNDKTCFELAAHGRTKFEEWEGTYTAAIKDSADEDFVAQLLVKYGHPLPVWATIQVLNFGSLPYLFELLTIDDQRDVAARFGVKQPRLFGAWLRAMIDLRNYCAHSSRLFNRVLKRAVKVTPAAIDQVMLGHVAHLATSTPEPMKRFYPYAALLAYMLRSHVSGTNWHLTLKTHARKLPVIQVEAMPPRALVSLEHDMGFPEDWSGLPLWN